MFEYIIFGVGFAFAAAVQPGPLQAFLLTSVAEKGWRCTLLAAFAPLLSDGPIALLVLLVLNRLPNEMSRVLRIMGGLLLLYLAGTAFGRWRNESDAVVDDSSSAPRTLFQATAINLLNPGPFLGWTLVLGPEVIRAWNQQPAYAVVLIAAFYITMVVSLALTIFLFGATRFLSPRGRRALILLSAIALAALGLYQLLSGIGLR